jgi:eukaryotic-like serine/threonine-protein kinase
MSSTANHPLAEQQAQSGSVSDSILQTGDGLLPQYFDGYRVIDRLGGGAMATVYRAINTESNQAVALKVLVPGADDILRERFRTEARTVSVLAHPHIVQTLSVGQTQNAFPYIAMELVEGDSLAGLLERQNQLSVADSCLLLEPIARALAYAHSHHVIHRDVKPSNILLRHAQPGDPHCIQLAALSTPIIPLLSDFGIARALDAPELTTVGRTIGTPAYMSPEQCAGTRNLDGRADIYSLATVLYRCLVGRPPFMGATTQILHAHVYEALTIPDAIAQALPPAMLSILRRALQKNPDDRYADMALFANDLSALLRYMRVPLNGTQEATVTLPLLTAHCATARTGKENRPCSCLRCD